MSYSMLQRRAPNNFKISALIQMTRRFMGKEYGHVGKNHHKSLPNYYKILQLEEFSEIEFEHVKDQYRKMAKLYHPDLQQTVNYEAHENFLLITEAYDILSNPDLKQRYDLSLKKEKDPNYTEDIVFEHPFAYSRRHAGFRHQNMEFSDDEENSQA